MNYQRLVAWLLIISSSTSFAEDGGNDVGNGGGTVTCKSSPQNDFVGEYFVDYVLSPFAPVEVKTLQESFDRIESGIAAKLPSMHESFRQFRNDFMNEDDFSREHIWEKAPSGVVKVEDSGILVATLPANCLEFHQAVIRVNPWASGFSEKKWVYKYVPETLARLESTGPLQLSYLMVHEWLWKYTSNMQSNRRMNALLHSSYLEKWDKEKWASASDSMQLLSSDPWSALSCNEDKSQIDTLIKNLPLKVSSFGSPYTEVPIKKITFLYRGAKNPVTEEALSLLKQQFEKVKALEVYSRDQILVRLPEYRSEKYTHKSTIVPDRGLPMYNRPPSTGSTVSAFNGMMFVGQMALTVGQDCQRIYSHGAEIEKWYYEKDLETVLFINF